MSDVELVAVWDFLNDSNIDEIVGSGVVTAKDAASFIASAYEASAAAFQVDESSPSESSVASDRASEVSTSDDDMKSTASASPPPMKLDMPKRSNSSTSIDQRDRQRMYDNRHREKKKARRVEAAKALVAGLKLLNVLLDDRILRTRRISATWRLLSLDKENRKFPDYDRDVEGIRHEAKTQLGLNQAATTYIELWTATWALNKIEKGKFFLKPYVADIERYLDGLVKFGEKLTEATTELAWCLDQKPSGVWV